MIFDEVRACRNDFELCKQTVLNALAEAEAIEKATAERMGAEMKRREQRRSELVELIADTERSGTVRHLAEIELSKLDEQSIGPTVAEVAAHAEQIELAKTAQRDILELEQKMRALMVAAKNELQEIRTATLGDQIVYLFQRHIGSRVASFEKLGGAADV